MYESSVFDIVQGHGRTWEEEARNVSACCQPLWHSASNARRWCQRPHPGSINQRKCRSSGSPGDVQAHRRFKVSLGKECVQGRQGSHTAEPRRGHGVPERSGSRHCYHYEQVVHLRAKLPLTVHFLLGIAKLAPKRKKLGFKETGNSWDLFFLKGYF